MFTDNEIAIIRAALTCHGTFYVFNNEAKGRAIYSLGEKLNKFLKEYQMININFTNDKGNYMLIHAPRPISEAKLDGTKYIVWDVNCREWIAARYMTNPVLGSMWIDTLTSDQLMNPTHFVEYFPEPTEN